MAVRLPATPSVLSVALPSRSELLLPDTRHVGWHPLLDTEELMGIDALRKSVGSHFCCERLRRLCAAPVRHPCLRDHEGIPITICRSGRPWHEAVRQRSYRRLLSADAPMETGSRGDADYHRHCPSVLSDGPFGLLLR